VSRGTDRYRAWIDGLKELAGRARVLMRVDRLIHGNRLPLAAGRRREGVASQRHCQGTRAQPERCAVGGHDQSCCKEVGQDEDDAYGVAEHLRTAEEMAAYLDAWLGEAPEDAAGIARALSHIARAKGMSRVAKDAGLSR